MCLYIKVLASFTSESGISFLGVGGGEGGGVGRTMGNKAFYWDGLTLSTVVMQDLLALIFSSDNGIHEAILFQFLNCCSLFYEKKLSFLGTINFLFERLQSNSLSEAAARSYKKREFWHQIKACAATHWNPNWLQISRHKQITEMYEPCPVEGAVQQDV